MLVFRSLVLTFKMETRQNHETSKLANQLVNTSIGVISIDVIEVGDTYLLPVGIRHQLLPTKVSSVYNDCFSVSGVISTTIYINGDQNPPSGGILVKKKVGVKTPKIYLPEHVYKELTSQVPSS